MLFYASLENWCALQQSFMSHPPEVILCLRNPFKPLILMIIIQFDVVGMFSA